QPSRRPRPSWRPPSQIDEDTAPRCIAWCSAVAHGPRDRSLHGRPGTMPQDLRDQDLLDYESRHQPLASMQRYALRLVVSFLIACLLIGGSLGAGMWGYAHFEGMSWLDAFLNAAMILSGMGPADQLKTDAGKV